MAAAERVPLPGPLARTRGWRPLDRAGYLAAWIVGVGVCVLTAAILIYMLVRGVQFLSLHTLFDHPTASPDQSKSGGFLDPLIGTLVIVAIGIAIAGPLGVASALWITEYGRPRWLARAVEAGVEVVAGTPSIVLAIFGLLIFSNAAFTLLSFKASGGAVFGRSFLIAGVMMALEALPLVFTATRESLRQIPRHVREASFALGKTRIATIRRVLLPAARPGMATGAILGMGRIAGDTAIVIVLLGGTLQLQGVGGVPILSTLRGTGGTLTSYVYGNSPAGEGNAPGKAYAAAFVLLVMIVAANFVVERIARRNQEALWIR
jgi:phosphate transport system permease protein